MTTALRASLKTAYSRIVIANGKNHGQKLSQSTIDRYISAFFRVHKAIGNELYAAELLDEYLTEEVQNCKSRRACTIAINHVVRNCDLFSGEQKDAMQALNNRICEECKTKKTVDETWKGKKMENLLKYRDIPYKTMLMSLSDGAKKRAEDGGDFNTKVMALAFALIACNPPLRNDYCKIIIKDRVTTLPAKTPYYHDGKLYFPEGSRIKTGNASPTLDVSECRGMIDEFIAQHRSKYILGYQMATNTFTHMLLDATNAQLGVKLGMRFFRTKYSTENSAQIHDVDHKLKVMDHSMPTSTVHYAAILQERPPMEDAMAFCC